jgi:hypothetical protein
VLRSTVHVSDLPRRLGRRRRPGPAPARRAPSAAQFAHDTRKPIVVVDEDTVLSLVERTRTCRVSTARDGGEALVILSSAEPVEPPPTDYLMPVHDRRRDREPRYARSASCRR